MTSEDLRDGLRNFYGTENYYKFIFSKAVYTDGVKFFADEAGAHWFLDIVCTEVTPFQSKEAFILIVLDVKEDKATIRGEDGNGNIFWNKDISFTDCPEGEWKFYLTNNVMMLTGEY